MNLCLWIYGIQQMAQIEIQIWRNLSLVTKTAVNWPGAALCLFSPRRVGAAGVFGVKLPGGALRTCERTVAKTAAAGEPDPGSIVCKRAAITLFNCLGLGNVGKPHVGSFASGRQKATICFTYMRKVRVCVCSVTRSPRDAKSGRGWILLGKKAVGRAQGRIPTMLPQLCSLRAEKVSPGLTLWGLERRPANHTARRSPSQSAVAYYLFYASVYIHL